MLFKRTKRFLFNSEQKYDNKELFLNWMVIICLFTTVLFGTLFGVYARGITIDSFAKVGVVKIPQPANSFSVVSFLSFAIVIISIFGKWTLRRKKRKLEEKKGL